MAYFLFFVMRTDTVYGTDWWSAQKRLTHAGLFSTPIYRFYILVVFLTLPPLSRPVKALNHQHFTLRTGKACTQHLSHVPQILHACSFLFLAIVCFIHFSQNPFMEPDRHQVAKSGTVFPFRPEVICVEWIRGWQNHPYWAWRRQTKHRVKRWSSILARASWCSALECQASLYACGDS